jgi:hypothetical protein
MLLNHKGESLYLLGKPWEVARLRFTQSMSLPHQGVLHRKELFARQGNFDESFRIAGDYELLLREVKSGEAAFIPNIVMTGMRQGGVSSNPKNSLALLREIRRAQKLHLNAGPSFVWLVAVARVYIRIFLWRTVGENSARRLLDLGRKLRGQPAFWTRT